MPDDLYHRDALAWAEQQAALLRRLARGERVNDVDWDHVVEEIADVGLSELTAANSLLRQMLTHLLKVIAWPDAQTTEHWLNEAANFQAEASDRFAPSMRQRIDIAAIHAKAVLTVHKLTHGGAPSGPLPVTCDLTLDELLTASPADLIQRLAPPSAPP